MSTARLGSNPCRYAVSKVHAFTLLETVVAVSITICLTAITLPLSLRAISKAHLTETTQALVWSLREVQAVAQTNGGHGLVELSRYTPAYFIYENSHLQRENHFEDGVNYKDGYLQMQDSRIGYNPYGDCAVAGAIHVVSAKDAQDIQLFMGSGLQSVVDVP
jgi:type II secretory pathway pseudopilin PulG